MDETPSSHTSDAPSPEFVRQVRDALQHYYDLAHLQEHPLAPAPALNHDGSREMAGQRVRRILLDAIETLNPGDDIHFRAPHARQYNLLTLHYIERETIQEAAYKLGISPRQALRNLRQAEASVAAILYARDPTASAEPSGVQISSFGAEMARLSVQSCLTDIRTLLEAAATAVAPLAALRGITVRLGLPPDLMNLQTDPEVAEQVLVSALSRAVSHARAGNLDVELSPDGDEVVLRMHYAAEAKIADDAALNPAAEQFAARLRWTVTRVDGAEGFCTVVLRMRARCPTVLIVDDNEGLVSLLERYLTHQACHVLAAMTGREALDVLRTESPDAILLDIMMPGRSGWELLQDLRSDPRTADIPVIVCSVINEPDLASALGASVFLSKPVTKDDVLAALRQLDVV